MEKPEIGNELEIKLKEKFPILTDADFYFEEGIGQDKIRMLENKLKKTKKEMREIIAGL